MPQEPYKPSGPYVIQSGPRMGQVLELLMFNNYPFLRWLLNKIEKEDRGKNRENRLHQHLRWLIAHGEDRPVPTVCPHCCQNPVAKIALSGSRKDGYSRDSFRLRVHTSCADCRRELHVFPAGNRQTILDLKFSTIVWRGFRQHDREQFVQFLKEIFQLPLDLNRQRAFEFFVAKPTPIQFAPHQLQLPMAGA